MSDQFLPVVANPLTSTGIVQKRLKDMGDGTVAEVVSANVSIASVSLTGVSYNSGNTDATTLRVITATDGPLNTNLGLTTDTAITSDANGTISGKMRGLVKMLSGVWNPTLNTLGVLGTGYVSQPTFNRPNNSTAYAAGNMVGSSTSANGAVITFNSIGPAAGDVLITDCDLMMNAVAVPSGMTSFRLHLYNATPPSAYGDNAAWDLPAGDQTVYLGYVDFGTPLDVGSTLFVQTSGVNKKLRMGASTSLYGYLVTNGGFTPAANMTVYPRLNAIGM